MASFTGMTSFLWSTLVSAPLTTEIATTKDAVAVAVAVAAAPASLVSAWA